MKEFLKQATIVIAGLSFVLFSLAWLIAGTQIELNDLMIYMVLTQ